MAATDVQLLPGLDDGPALLVFISPRRFALMTPTAASELRDQLQAALEQCATNVGWVQRSETHQAAPEQLKLIEGERCELPRILQRQAS
jgi:hypothetical protein